MRERFKMANQRRYVVCGKICSVIPGYRRWFRRYPPLINVEFDEANAAKMDMMRTHIEGWDRRMVGIPWNHEEPPGIGDLVWLQMNILSDTLFSIERMVTERQ